MTLEERYELSCYEELVQLQENKSVWLVRHNESSILYVKKHIELYNRDIYTQLRTAKIPNVPEVVCCVEENDKLIVIEEYIHGVSLKRMLEIDGLFSENRVVGIMLQLCDIVAQLHSCQPPIIHRDIKPSNIMLSNDGIVKLIDFNAAKQFSSGRNEDTWLLGTQKFAAPEQYGFGQSDQRTDIYAIGVTMHYLLTGCFPKETVITGKINEIISRCVSLSKEERYQNVQELQRSLMRLQGSSSVPEKKQPQTTGNIFTRPLYRRKELFPVGFRSGVLWKMLVGLYGYLMIFSVCLEMTVTNEKGVSMTGYPLWANRIAALAFMLGSVLFLGNYCGIRNQFPLMNGSRFVRWSMSFIYLSAYMVLVIMLLVFLGGGG